MELVIAGLIFPSALASPSATKSFEMVCSIDTRWNKGKYVLTANGNTNTAVRDKKASNSLGSDISVVQGDKRDHHARPTTALPTNDNSRRHSASEHSWLDALTPLVRSSG